MHLRVWWKEEESIGFMKHREVEKTGIVISGATHGEIIIRTDDGELAYIHHNTIDKSEWVNHPTNAD